VFLLVNFVGTVFVSVAGNADPLIAIGSYIVQTNLYILTFSFFARTQGLTLAFGGLLLGIGYYLSACSTAGRARSSWIATPFYVCIRI